MIAASTRSGMSARSPSWSLKEGATVTAEELSAFLEPRFAKFWLPDEFVFIERDPANGRGQVPEVRTT